MDHSNHQSTQTVSAHRPGEENAVELNFANLRLFSYGVYANVYIGELMEDGKSMTVAVKKCWNQTDCKEIKILQKLNRTKHNNIVNLMYVFETRYGEKTCYSLVMGFMPMTLSTFLKRSKPIPLAGVDTKLYIWQIFRALQFLRKHNIIHRDLKPQNILLEPEKGLIQVADFGSSAIVGDQHTMSSYHVTRYYRPPELLLGAHMYGTEIDVWSAGCVFGEMLRGRTFLAGLTTEDQLVRIVHEFGMPSEADKEAMKIRKPKMLTEKHVLNAEKAYNKRGGNGLRELCPQAPEEALHLLQQVMVYNPMKRLCGPKFLGDKYFDELFDPRTLRNGKPITTLTRADLAAAVAGDKSKEDLSSFTGGVSNEK